MNEPVLDSAIFNEMSELMDDALSEFIDTFLDNSPKLLSAIEKGLAENDSEAVFHNAHQLKGGSGSIGAMQVFTLANQLEEMARGKVSTGMLEMFGELKMAYAELTPVLKSYL